MSIRYIIILLLCCGVLACNKPTINQLPTVDDSTTITNPEAITPPIYKLDSTERLFCGWSTSYKGGPWGHDDSTWIDSFYLYTEVRHNKTTKLDELEVFNYSQGQRNTLFTLYTQDTSSIILYPNTVHYSIITPSSSNNIYFDTVNNKIVSYKANSSYHSSGYPVGWGQYMSEK